MTDFETAPELTLSSTPLIRVLIVEDHQMFAEALARGLRDEPDIRVDGISRRLDDAREFLRRKHVDVVLMDFHLPDGDGIVASRYILEEHPRTRVIVVSAVEDRQVLDDALAAGCSGFISKSESLDHLPSAIRGAMVGNVAISPAMVAKLVGPVPAAHHGYGDDLSPRELEVLQLLAQGWDNLAIEQQLFMSHATLRNRLSRINSKLATHSKLEAVTKALRLGLVQIEREDGSVESRIVAVPRPPA
jgi:DNA-binding NarL/FixJ family response regulator